MYLYLLNVIDGGILEYYIWISIVILFHELHVAYNLSIFRDKRYDYTLKFNKLIRVLSKVLLNTKHIWANVFKTEVFNSVWAFVICHKKSVCIENGLVCSETVVFNHAYVAAVFIFFLFKISVFHRQTIQRKMHASRLDGHGP